MAQVTAKALIIGCRGRRLRAEAPTLVSSVRLSPAELERLKKAAGVNHQSVSEFARDALITAADDCLEVINGRVT